MHKLQQHEVDVNDFWGKILFLGFLRKLAKMAQNNVFQVLWKIDGHFYFLDKVTVAYQRKIDLNGFFGKKICFEVFGPKGAQNEVFLVLSKVYAWNFPDFFFMLRFWLRIYFTLEDPISHKSWFWNNIFWRDLFCNQFL